MTTSFTLPIFKEEWPEFAGVAARMAFKKRAEIFRQGDEVEAVYYVSRGWVKMVRGDYHGREVIVSLRKPGRMLGLATAIAETPYEMSAVASSDCALERIPIGAFTELIGKDSNLCRRVTKLACRSSLEIAAHLMRINELSVREHLEYLLCEFLSEQYGGNLPPKDAPLRLPVSDKEIARMLSTSPQTLCETFRELFEEGVARREGRSGLKISAPQRLRRSTDPVRSLAF